MLHTTIHTGVTNVDSMYCYTTLYKDQFRYCDTCNRPFISEKCFYNHLMLRVKGKVVCQWRLLCRNCNFLKTNDFNYEFFRKCCTYCNKKQPSGHFCYVAPLKPSKLSNKYKFVFFDTDCTQDLEKRDGSFEQVPNLICSQQMCLKFEVIGDMNIYCEQCGKRVHVFWNDSIGKFIEYLRLSRQFADKIYKVRSVENRNFLQSTYCKH